jgi:hypothetical protein
MPSRSCPARLASLASLCALGLGLGACQKLNPNFIEPIDSETVGTTGTVTGTTAEVSTTGTGGSADDTTTSATTGGLACAPALESIRIAIFEPKCTNEGCHVGDKPAASLDLTTADLYVDLLDVPSAICAEWSRVVAQEPELSILYAKFGQIATCTPVDPVEHEPLTAEELECLAGWIETIEVCERCGGSECLDLQTDALNCGACGAPCPPGIECVAGMCDCQALTACGNECVDVQVDGTHCGGCDNDCNGAACLGGNCDCAIELLNCGACIDPMTDEQHCGGCDQPCGLGETCQGGTCQCSDIPVSFATQVQPIFNDNCVQGNCHGGSNPKEGLDLEDGNAITHLVNVLASQCADGRFRVEPGDPVNSYLLQKVLGVDMCSGVQMPQTGGPGAVLGDPEIDVMTAWICQGALDN